MKTYDIEELAARPAIIQVGTSYQTRIEFPGEIRNPSMGRQEWFTIEQQGNYLAVRADVPAGRTDLMVTVGGRTVMFILEIDDTLDAPQRVVVARKEEAAPRASSARSRAAPALHDRQPTANSSGSNASSIDVRDKAWPAWLSFEAEAVYAANGTLAIHYALANQSTHPLASDTTQLRLEALDPLVGPVKLAYQLTRISVPGHVNRVAPDGVEFGTIVIDEAPDAPIRLTWHIVQIGPARHFKVTKTFQRGFVRGSQH